MYNPFYMISVPPAGNYPLNLAFIYGYKPSGHYTAAMAVAQFIPREIARVHFINLSDIYPHLGPLVAKTYLQILQKTPNLWGYLYNNSLFTGVKPFIPEFYMNKIKQLIVKKHISAIVSTHAFSSILTSHKSMNLKHIKNFAVITDIYAHSFWPKTLNRYFVPTKEAHDNLEENGIPPEKITVSGMPVRKEFSQKYDPNSQKKELGLSSKIPVFLISGGGRGLGDIKDALEILSKSGNKAQVVILCGENKKLIKETAEYKKPGLTIKILPYIKNPSAYYSVSDCMIGKAGGITIFEMAALKKPLIIYSPLPGQEERNAAYLSKRRCAVYAKSKKELEERVGDFFSDRKSFRDCGENLNALYKKDAALSISAEIIKEITS